MISWFAMFNSLCRWAECFSRRLLSVAIFSKCSLVCYNCSLKSQWWVWISVELLVVYLCFCDLQEANPVSTLNFTVYFQFMCLQAVFWLWISGEPRLEGNGLPSKTFKMLQKWPARDAATRNLMNGNILYSWTIVKRVKWTFRGRENTSWIVTCGWWLLSQPWSSSFLSFVVGSMLANLYTSKLDLQSPQWRNTINADFCKTKVTRRAHSKSCMRRLNFGQATHK